jgi:hypothetical protein
MPGIFQPNALRRKTSDRPHAAPDTPHTSPPAVPPTQDGQPDGSKQSGQSARKAQPINQNLPQAQGARQPDRGGKK